MRRAVQAGVGAVSAVVGALVALPSTTVSNDLQSADLRSTTAVVTVADAAQRTSTPPVVIPEATNLGPSARAQVRLVVANASGRPGAATEVAATLGGVGFVSVTAADANERLDMSRVYFEPGAENAAEDVAALLGLGPDAVTPRPSDPLTVLGEEADVWVMIGARS